MKELPSFIKNIETKYSGPGEKRLVVAHYMDNDAPALFITSLNHEPLLTASVNIDGSTHEDGIIIKDWSENEGIAEALLKANLIEPYPNEVLHATGFVVAQEYRMKNELLAAWQEHLLQKPW